MMYQMCIVCVLTFDRFWPEGGGSTARRNRFDAEETLFSQFSKKMRTLLLTTSFARILIF